MPIIWPPAPIGCVRVVEHVSCATESAGLSGSGDRFGKAERVVLVVGLRIPGLREEPTWVIIVVKNDLMVAIPANAVRRLNFRRAQIQIEDFTDW